jgi:hypothetical protein
LAWEEESVRECSILLHNVILQDNVNDYCWWRLDPVHVYTVREAYKFIIHSGSTDDRSCVDDVWHKQVPLKVSLMAWRLLRNRLPTKDNLLRRNIINSDDTMCATAGCGIMESAQHLFLHCDTSRELWHNVLNWLGLSFVPPL